MGHLDMSCTHADSRNRYVLVEGLGTGTVLLALVPELLSLPQPWQAQDPPPLS